MTIDTLLFDLDGTLVDSVRDLATALNLLRGERDLPPLPLDRVRTCFCPWRPGHHGDSPYDDLATTPADLARLNPGAAP